jgi:membrane protease YdiL (CAAX protease family)
MRLELFRKPACAEIRDFRENYSGVSMASYSDYASRGELRWWRYAATLAVAVLLFVIAPTLVVAALMLTRLWPQDALAAAQDPSRFVPFFLFNGCAFFALLAAFAAAARLVQRKRFGDIVGRWSCRLFGTGFGVWVVVLCGLTLVDVAIAPDGFRLSATAATPQLALVAGVALAVQTFTEEFVFRGYITQALLLATRRVPLAALISGLLFGAMHIPNGAPQAVSAAIFGVVLSVIAIRTGGIAFTFGLHLANNLFGAVVVASSNDAFHGVPALFSQNTPQLMWWDTAVGALALVGLLLWVARRRASGAGAPGEQPDAAGQRAEAG